MFILKAFLGLAWPHLGLYLEISRLEISPRKLSWPFPWPHLGLYLEMSRLEISPRKFSWPYLGHMFFFIWKGPRPKISPRKLSEPHLGLHLKISRPDILQESFLDPILATSWASSPTLFRSRTQKWEQERESKIEQTGNRVGSSTQTWEQEAIKVGTKWERSMAKNPKVGTRGDQSGNRVGSRTLTKVGTNWGQSGITHPEVGTRQDQSGNRVGSRTQKWGTRRDQRWN